MSTLDNNYIEALIEAKKYHEDPEGLSGFQGVSLGDKTDVRQHNIEIILLIKLHNKLDNLVAKLQNLEDRVQNLEKCKNPEVSSTPGLEDLIDKFKNFKVNSDNGILQPKKSSYRYY